MPETPLISLDDAAFQRDVRQVTKRLGDFPKKVQKTIGRRALREGAKYLQAHAKIIAPVGKSYTRKGVEHTGGTLQAKGIVVRSTKAKGRGEIAVRTTTAKRSVFGIPDNDKWYYPNIVEHGAKKGQHQFPGRFYMKKTFDRNSGQAIQIVMTRLWAGIEAQA